VIVEHLPDGRTVMDTQALAAITARPPALIRRHCTRDDTGRYDARACPETLAPLPDPVLLTAAQAGQYLGIPPGTVRSWAGRGQLRAWDRDRAGRPLYDADDLRNLRDA
jgi:hypothetical protein